MYGIIIEEKQRLSQYRQFYEQLREKILSGDISEGEKLASSRKMAESLHIARSVIIEVYDQLCMEGFLDARGGSGTYIAEGLRRPDNSKSEKLPPEAQHLIEADVDYSFLAGIPSSTLFPRKAWNRCYQSVLEYGIDTDFHYSPGQGRPDLLAALQDYLYRNKGIRCSRSNIIICSGAAQGLAILAEIRSGGKVTLEDPLAPFVYNIFKRFHYSVQFSALDWEGVLPDSLSPDACDYIYTAPSHQFPLGGTLSARRRITILDWACKTGAYVIEDDYDSEFRYTGRPIAPMQVLDPDRVIYVGTFSKILSPALRLSYMVVPDSLTSAIMEMKSRMEYLGEGLQQAAMAKFIYEGHLESHLRRSIREYKRRRAQILEDAGEIFGDSAEIINNHTGLHFVLRIPGRYFLPEILEEALKERLFIKPVSSYSIQCRDFYDSLVLGFGLLDRKEITPAISRLSRLINRMK